MRRSYWGSRDEILSYLRDW